MDLKTERLAVSLFADELAQAPSSPRCSCCFCALTVDWDSLARGMTLGKHPRVFITTTPRLLTSDTGPA